MTKAALVAYVLKAMMSWSPVSQHTPAEKQEDAEARYKSIAEDIAEVAMDPIESVAPVDLRSVDGRVLVQSSDAKNAILVAAVASLETNFAKFVDDGTCNQPGYKPDARGSCDGRNAWTMWQLHTMGGIVIRGDEIVGRAYATPEELANPSLLWTGPKLVADRKGAARVALHEMRYSMRRTKTLCLYAGETDREHPGSCRVVCSGSPEKCVVAIPLATARLSRAVSYLAQNPVEVSEI
jgi:hypothetical protein